MFGGIVLMGCGYIIYEYVEIESMNMIKLRTTQIRCNNREPIGKW
jgi:hypothetical protein